MSHFTVLVRLPAAEIENLEGDALLALLTEKLQPYHEFECTGTKDQYVTEFDETDEKLAEYDTDTMQMVFNSSNEPVASKYSEKLERYKNNNGELSLPSGWEIRETPVKDVYSFEEYLRDWCGYDFDGKYSDFRDGRFYKYTNKNAKWDWWTVGGRWKDHFLCIDGSSDDSVLKREWDIETASKNAVLKYIPFYDVYSAHTFENEFISWEKCRELNPDDSNAARELYWKQPFRAEFADVMTKAPLTTEQSWIVREPDLFWNVPREKFIADRVFAELGTYAVLDNEWYEKGEMGWFGMSSNENENWNELYFDKIKSFDDNDLLVLVDCHI